MKAAIIGRLYLCECVFSLISAGDGNDATFPIGSVGKASANVFFGEFWIIAEDLFVRHPSGEPAEHVRDGNSHRSNRRSAAALALFDGDDVLIVHSSYHFSHLARGQCGLI